MRGLISLFMLAICGGAASAATCSGEAFYPPGHADTQLTIGATIVGQQVVTRSVRIGLDPLRMTMMLNPRNRIVSTYLADKAKNLLSLDLDFDRAGKIATGGEITVYYPNNLAQLPMVTVQSGTTVQRLRVVRDPQQPKLMDVSAKFNVPPQSVAQFRLGSLLQVKVYDASGDLIEQASFKIPDASAWQGLVRDARTDLAKECSAVSEGF